MRRGRILGSLLASLLIMIGIVGVAGAESTLQAQSFMATISSREEVPTNASTATGQAMFEVAADGSSIRYSVTVNNLQNLVMGHIHVGARGENGPVVVPLFPPAQPGGGQRSGTVGEGTITAAQLQGPLQGRPLSELISAMQAGNTYVNLHTNSGAAGATPAPGNLPAGEIRGQIVATPTAPRTGGGNLAGLSVPAGWMATGVGLGLALALVLEGRRRARQVR